MMKISSLLAGASLLAGIVGFSPLAQAGSFRYPASVCTMESDVITDYVFKQGIANISAGLIGARPRVLHCPILQEDGDFSAINNIGFNGWDRNNETTDGNLQVRFCHSLWYGGLSCTGWVDLNNSSSSATFTGNVASSLPPSVISQIKNTVAAGSYPELLIKLPRHGVYGDSELYGYRVY